MKRMKLEEIKSLLSKEHSFIRAKVERETIDEENRTVELSVSSEFPVWRYWGFEILDHKKSSVRLDRFKDSAAIRDTHFGDQIGVVEKAWVDAGEKKLRVKARFSANTPRANEIFKDIVDGIRRNVSIYYDIYELVLDKEVDDIPYYRAIDWEPVHVSIEADGEDPTVGVGRSKDGNDEAPLIFNAADLDDETINLIRSKYADKEVLIINQFTNQKGNRNMNRSMFRLMRLFNQDDTGGAAPPATPPKTDETEIRVKVENELRSKIEKESATRSADILQIAEDFSKNVPHVNLREKALEFISDTNKSARDFYNYCSKEMRSPEAVRRPAVQPDLSDQEAATYSLAEAIRCMASGEYDKLGIVKEVSDYINSKVNRELTRGRILVPTNQLTIKSADGDKLINMRSRLSNKRAAEQNVATPSAGGYTVFEDVIDQTFVEYLHKKSAFVDSGVVFLPGLEGDIPFVREMDEHTFYWVGESGSITKSGITFAKEVKSPKIGGAKTSISGKLLKQSRFVSEAYTRRKIMGTLQRGYDRAIGYGLGTGNQPAGIKAVTGVHPINGVDYDRDRAIDQKSVIRSSEAEVGNVKFIANSNTVGILQKKPIVANYPLFLCNDDNKMIAREVKESNQVDDGDLFYGVFGTIYLLEWGFIEIGVNPYGSGWDTGDIDVRAFGAIDLFYEYPEALSVATNVS